MTLPIYELKISENLNDEAMVDYIALVDAPAIKKDFLAFNEQFIEPSKGEHEGDFLQRCIKYVIDEGKESEQAVAICNSLWQQHFADETCPIATQDIKTNLKDRQNAIDVAHYGPLNPNLPSEEYWTRKAKQFNATVDEAKKSVCGNCAFFNVSQKIKDCIATGIGNEIDPYNVIDAGDLGYCEAFDFKCASKRTCDAWVVGGPLEFAGVKVSIDYDDTLSTERGKELAKRLINEGDIVYIISARNNVEGMLGVAESLGIPKSRVYATGSNKAKVQKIKDLGITKHYDNNEDVVNQLEGIGKKFAQQFAFSILSEEKRIISGALMLADELIYRNNEKFGEHYVKFSAETIKSIAIKWAKKNFNNHVNLMHDPEQKVKGVTMFESWLVDSERGIMPMKGFEGCSDGSWFGSFYVENEKVWQSIKKGDYKGFSVEGLFDYVEPITAEENALKKISELLNSIITD